MLSRKPTTLLREQDTHGSGCQAAANAGSVSRRRRQTGATLIELIVSSAVGVLVISTLLMLVVQVAKEQRRGLVDTTLQQQAGILEDKITRLVRSMSASETILLAEPIATGSPFYRRVVMARGQTPTYPREELIYDVAAGKVTHDPDRSVSGNELALFAPTGKASMMVLRNLYFFSSVKLDGSPDSSVLNVFMEFDDNSFAGRKDASGSLKKTRVLRTFSVKMRNN
jgi:Tfp pilus assembly protein PilE